MSNAMGQVKIAIGAEFLTAFARLPGKQQGKVGHFLEKFRSNPMAGSIHYEKITGAKDANLRSVRIDQTYRGIVLKPQRGNVYMLLWVDHHDEAYAWARQRRFTINAHTGSLQVVATEAAPASGKAAEKRLPVVERGLFKDVKDKPLLKLGVPDPLLPAVRQVQTDTDLEELEGQLPQEAAEALFLLAAGFSLEETFLETAKSLDKIPAVDTSDYAAALVNEDSRRRFHVIADAMELAEILKAPLEKWRVFLHPSQRQLVEMTANGPVRVLGGAGTGKTVVAMHRARYLAQEVFTKSGDRILFTTFTRNLAEDIRANLKQICPLDVMRRIDVINLDAWVHQYLKKNGYEHSLLFSSTTRKEYWQEAMQSAPDDPDLPQSFYEQEWEHVVQAQAVAREADYLRASRLGRGRRLSRRQRKQIWPVFEEYRAILNRNNRKEFIDATRDARALLESRGDTLVYQAVVVDEAQDMSAEAFKLIRQIVPPTRPDVKNDIYIVGDAHQRIYAHRVVLGRCGIEIRGRARKLRLNYRTTDEIRRWATALLEDRDIDDLDGGKDSNAGYRSLLHGDLPAVKSFASFDEEAAHIAALLADFSSQGIPLNTVCLVARTGALLEQYEAALEPQGLPVARIDQNTSDDRDAEGLRTATMHRVKGLEFDHMLVAAVNEGVLPLAAVAQSHDNDFARYEFETKERSLLYVAATRAKKSVLLTSFDTPSPLLPS